MRNIFFSILLLKLSFGISQAYLFGDFQQRYPIEKQLYLEDQYHSISKPILLDSGLKKLMQMGIWPYGNLSNNDKFVVLPVIDAGLKHNSTGQDFTNAL